MNNVMTILILIYFNLLPVHEYKFDYKCTLNEDIILNLNIPI